MIKTNGIGLLVLASLLQAAQLATCGPVQELAAVDQPEGGVAAGRRPIFFSELKLRSVIEETNLELRELKRDFMRHMSDLYLGLKLDPTVGFEIARDEPANRPAGANMLLAAELASMVMRKHIVQRRLLTGLKMAFVKFLPMQTLVNLFRRYKSYEWLRDQQQVELRPKFPEAKENQFVILYTLVELRARLRAADDVFALTEDSARRALQVAQWFLVDSNHLDDNHDEASEVRGEQLEALARNMKQVLEFYQDEVVAWRANLRDRYETFLKSAAPLAAMLPGGQSELIEFIDRLVNIEALDIDLNGEARQLEVPPTITEEMIANVQKRWLPWYVLKSVEEDRKLLVANPKRVMHLVHLNPNYKDADLDEWSANLINYICRNSVNYLG